MSNKNEGRWLRVIVTSIGPVLVIGFLALDLVSSRNPLSVLGTLGIAVVLVWVFTRFDRNVAIMRDSLKSIEGKLSDDGEVQSVEILDTLSRIELNLPEEGEIRLTEILLRLERIEEKLRSL